MQIIHRVSFDNSFAFTQASALHGGWLINKSVMQGWCVRIEAGLFTN